MIKSTPAIKEKAVKAAFGSVRAEGLSPSRAVQNNLSSYARGEKSISSVRKDTLLRISSSTHYISSSNISLK